MHLSSHWQLNPEVDFLNHGSFGATPRIVLQEQQRLRDELERDPIEFLATERELYGKLDDVRGDLAKFVGSDPADLVFVRTATDGVNAVLRSMPLSAGDQILVTDHGYNACNNAARYVAEQCDAEVVVAEVPFPLSSPDQVVQAIDEALTPRTRVLLIDHVTSPTGLVFPIDQIVQAARARGVRVLVDGAHAPGMVPVDLDRIQPDYYTGNHHKWLCAPKVSGFLYARRELQSEVRPTVISHGANQCPEGRSRFTTEFDWCGTFDPTPLLSLPATLQFLRSLYSGGIEQLMMTNRQLAIETQRRLCEALQIQPPAPQSMIGSLVSVPLPSDRGGDARRDNARRDNARRDNAKQSFQQRLVQQHRVEAPIFSWPKPDGRMLRVSLQAYNHLNQIDRLCDILRKEWSR